MSNTMKPGDNVLLFLRIDEESKHLELTDYRDGMKNLPSEDMDVYEARIKELGSIFTAEKPDPEKIIDWLVRCAEEPATRWEGTYELEQSFNALEYKAQRDAERKEKIANDEKVEGEDIYFDEGFETGRTTIFAKLLNNYQKQTLANILLNSEFQAAPKRRGEDGFVRGDSELMELVSLWADTRVAGVYLHRLRGGTYLAQEKAELMERIAAILDDKQTTAIAEKFGNNCYESDDSEVDESGLKDREEAATDDDSIAELESSERATPVVETPDEEESEPKTEGTKEVEAVKKPVILYKQYREELVSKFLLRADQVIANPDACVPPKK